MKKVIGYIIIFGLVLTGIIMQYVDEGLIGVLKLFGMLFISAIILLILAWLFDFNQKE